ncbi:MAG TPA: SBBP repeat-containing protein [Chitinophagales bacterium]|nr:SBBP repeat-containing protein [Chitinophagales bacterium]
MKAKRYFSIILLSLFFSVYEKANAQAPDWLWAKAMGGIDYDYGYSTALDPAGSGDVYTTGRFAGTVDFDPGAGVFNLTSPGGYDIFISKLDASGNFIWAKAMGGTGECSGNSIAIDPAGNGDVYITGYFYGAVDFNPDSSGNFNLTSAGQYDIFISKLDSSGNFVWAKRIGGTSYDHPNSIALDPAGSGDVYTTGSFAGTVDFDPDSSGTFNLTSSGSYDIFISKLNDSGNFIWAKAMGGTGEGFGHFIVLDPAGSEDVYTTGSFQGTVDFDPDSSGSFNLTSAGQDDIFISKLDSSGNFVWAKAMGATSYDAGQSIAVDVSGNVYTTGSFAGTVDFDPDSSGNFNLTSAGAFDIFISKFDTSGNLVWAKAMGGTDTEKGWSIAIDPAGSGDVYTTGYFSGTADFDPDSSGNFNLTFAGHDDIFISKLDSSGNFVWAKAIGGTSYDYAQSIVLDALGNVYMTGYFSSASISFGSTTLTNANNSGNYADIFVAKLDTELATGYNEMENLDKSMFLFPNPASDKITLSFSSSGKKEIQITNMLRTSNYY